LPTPCLSIYNSAKRERQSTDSNKDEACYLNSRKAGTMAHKEKRVSGSRLSTLVRISIAAHENLSFVAKATGKPMGEVIRESMHAYNEKPEIKEITREYLDFMQKRASVRMKHQKKGGHDAD
jgi:hypothetical protein